MKYLLVLLLASTSSTFGEKKEYIPVKPPKKLEGIEYSTRKCEVVKGEKVCTAWDTGLVTSETHQLGHRVKEVTKPKPKKVVPKPERVYVHVPVEVQMYRPFFIGGAIGRGLGDIKFSETATSADVAEKEQTIYHITAGWNYSYNAGVYGVWVPDREGYLAGWVYRFGESRVR